MRIVLDTNVIVSAFLRPAGPPGRILDLVLEGSLIVLYDERIIAEYRDVLGREKFRFPHEDVDALLVFIQAAGESVEWSSPLSVDLPDLDDAPFLEVAVSAGAAALVTGNRRHFPDGCGVEVKTPSEFLSQT